MRPFLGLFGAVSMIAGLASCTPDTGFQAQSQAQADSSSGGLPGSSPGSIPEGGTPKFQEPGTTTEGIIGGHFDLDTSHLVYAPDKGTTDHHVHQYDDIYKTNGADFFKFADAGLGEIKDTIPAQKRFILIVSNAELSPGGVLEINGAPGNVLAFQTKNRATTTGGQALPVYTIGAPTTAGDLQLKAFKIYFDLNVIAQKGLIPTATGCVRRNQAGAKGEYRDGALIIQALDADHYKIDPATGVAAATDGGLLWESTLFWHRDDTCY